MDVQDGRHGGRVLAEARPGPGAQRERRQVRAIQFQRPVGLALRSEPNVAGPALRSPPRAGVSIARPSSAASTATGSARTAGASMGGSDRMQAMSARKANRMDAPVESKEKACTDGGLPPQGAITS